jgi:hypothetical protein
VGPQLSWDLLHLYSKTDIKVGTSVPKYSTTSTITTIPTFIQVLVYKCKRSHENFFELTYVCALVLQSRHSRRVYAFVNVFTVFGRLRGSVYGTSFLLFTSICTSYIIILDVS